MRCVRVDPWRSLPSAPRPVSPRMHSPDRRPRRRRHGRPRPCPAAADAFLRAAVDHHGIQGRKERRRDPRLLLPGRLLVARPGEARRPPYVDRDGWSNPESSAATAWRWSGSHAESVPSAPDSRSPANGSMPIRRSCTSGHGRRPGHSDESEPALQPGHPRFGHRPRRGHHRHDPSDRGVGHGRDSGRQRRDAAPDAGPITSWFRDDLTWLTTNPFGIDERDRGNNHGTCWLTQVSAFARMLGDRERSITVGHASRRGFCRTICSRTAASRSRCAAASLTATRCSSSTSWQRWPRSSRPC